MKGLIYTNIILLERIKRVIAVEGDKGATHWPGARLLTLRT